MLMERMISLLCCPECSADIEVLPIELVMGEVREGILRCIKTGKVVAVIKNYGIDFLLRDKNMDLKDIQLKIKKRELPIVRDYEFEARKISFNDPMISYIGEWRLLEDKYIYAEGKSVDKAILEVDCLSFSVALLNHPWSGNVLIRVDDRYECVYDLFQPVGSELKLYSLRETLPNGRHIIEIIPFGTKNENSAASQVIISHFIIATDKKVYKRHRMAENRGNPFPQKFFELIKQVPKDGLILDCGGGDRHIGDERCINFEYMKYELPDVYGDGHCLPFKSNSFDLVLSQAVMEHLYDPFKGADEIYRATKPNGMLWAEIAFMQPLHAVPFHFFNSTVWGIEELFKKFKKIESGYFGNLSFTFDWMIRSTSIIGHIGEERYGKIFEIFKELDMYVTHEEMKNIASGVSLYGIKEVS